MDQPQQSRPMPSMNYFVDASGYCEASAKTGAGVDDVIECCVRAVLNAKDREKSGKSRRFALPWKRCVT